MDYAQRKERFSKGLRILVLVHEGSFKSLKMNQYGNSALWSYLEFNTMEFMDYSDSMHEKDLFQKIRRGGYTHVISYKKAVNEDGATLKKFNFLGYSVKFLCVDSNIFNLSKQHLYDYKLYEYLKSNPYRTGHTHTENTEIVEVTGVAQFREILQEIKDVGWVCIDTETSGLAQYKEHFYCTMLQLTYKVGKTVIVPMTPRNPNLHYCGIDPAQDFEELHRLNTTKLPKPVKDEGQGNYIELVKKLESEKLEQKKAKAFWKEHSGEGVCTETEIIDGQEVETIYTGGALCHVHSLSNEDLQTIQDLVVTELCNNPKIRIVGHNLKYDMHVIKSIFTKNHNVKWLCQVADTLTAQHLLDENRNSYSLDTLQQEYLPKFGKFKHITKIFEKRFDRIPYKILEKYGSMDTDVTFRLHSILIKQLREKPTLLRYFESMQMFALPALWRLEYTGYKPNETVLEESAKIMQEKLAEMDEKIFSNTVVAQYNAHLRYVLKQNLLTDTKRRIEVQKEKIKASNTKKQKAYDTKLEAFQTKLAEYGAKKLAGGKAGRKPTKPKTFVPKTTNATLDKLHAKLNAIGWGEFEKPVFNPASPKQLGEILYTEAGFNIPERKTPKGSYLTDKNTLKDIAERGLTGDNTLLSDILEYRQLSKFLSTYIVGIMDSIGADGLVHSSYDFKPTTGRLASKNPNLQNIPKRSPNAKLIKKAFEVRAKDTVMIQFDLSQAELRMVAYYAGVKSMIEAYREGKDLHRLRAMEKLGMGEEQFSKLDAKKQKHYRFLSKADNFGLIYGMSAKGFMEYSKNEYGIEMTLEEATESRDNYFKAKPELQPWYQKMITMGQKLGYVETLCGRRRHLPQLNNNIDDRLRSDAERQAVNAPIQGSIGEWTVFAIGWLHRLLPANKVNMIGTIHDSILFEVHKGYVPTLLELVKYVYSNIPVKDTFGKKMEGLPMITDAELGLKWSELIELDSKNTWEKVAQELF